MTECFSRSDIVVALQGDESAYGLRVSLLHRHTRFRLKASNVEVRLKETPCYITPYENPDLDGVASAIGYALLKSATGKQGHVAAYWGQLNAQTTFVLDYFGIQKIERLATIPLAQFVLVDTHHVNQLPAGFPCDRVIEVVDHHPGGDPDSFPLAKIQNEEVGAAATLIAEKFFESGVAILPEIAGLLASAIVSNTIDFAAPSSTQRDRAAFDGLKTYVNFPESLIAELFRATFPVEAKSSLDCIRADVKIFAFGEIRVGLSQLEAIGIEGLLLRDDFAEAMENFKNEKSLDYLLFNGIDLNQKVSFVQVDSSSTAALFSRLLGVNFDGNFARLGRIILRKSDLVSPLRSHFIGGVRP